MTEVTPLPGQSVPPPTPPVQGPTSTDPVAAVANRVEDIATSVQRLEGLIGSANGLPAAEPGSSTSEWASKNWVQGATGVFTILGAANAYHATPAVQAAIVAAGLTVIGAVEGAYSIGRAIRKRGTRA